MEISGSQIKICCIVIFFLLSFSCHRQAPSVAEVLAKAGSNKNELVKVIDHYIELGDDEKLKAAYFLIGNMGNKKGHFGDFVSAFFPVFTTVRSLRESQLEGDTINKIVKSQWDSIEAKIGKINDENYPISYDYSCITANYLISNIDMAFKAWREKPWARHVNFDDFCQFILPYRVFDEPLQFDRKQIFESFSWLEDSLKNKNDPKEACLVVNRFISKRFAFSYMLEKCPMLGVRNMLALYAGVCLHRYILTVSIMRSLGIPIAINFSPQYNDVPGSHYWLSVLDQNNKMRPFNGGDETPFGKYPYDTFFPDSIFAPVGNGKSTKVYGVNFGNTVSLIRSQKDYKLLPPFLSNTDLVDVTGQYDFPKSDIRIKLDVSKPDSCDAVILCCFGASFPLVPVDYALPTAGFAEFHNVGRSAVYIAAYYLDNKFIIASQPYYYPEKERVQILKPNFNKFDTVTLVRKYPAFETDFAQMMVGAKFQGANNKKFLNAKTLYTIDSIYMYFAERNISCHKPFRYYRYLSSDKGDIHIAEIDFMQKNEDHNPNKKKSYKMYGRLFHDTSKTVPAFKNAFDGDISTNFNAPAKSWVAIDFGRRVNINKIRFCVRNDLNVIEVGDIYELFYFDMGWVSLGRKLAYQNNIFFSKVPNNSLLLLRDLSKGKQERIFVYRDGKQIWL